MNDDTEPRIPRHTDNPPTVCECDGRSHTDDRPCAWCRMQGHDEPADVRTDDEITQTLRGA